MRPLGGRPDRDRAAGRGGRAARRIVPGVYRYFDAASAPGAVCRQGAQPEAASPATSTNHGGTRIGARSARIARLETTVVRTEAEALLLENNLIKALNPRFNILFRDDKSYPT